MREIRVLGLLALGLLSSCDLFEPALYDLCEDGFKERLKSPSSYERIAVSMSKNSADETAFFVFRDITGSAQRENYKIRWKREPADFQRYKIDFNYDAQNAFGAAIRGYFRCEFYTDDGRLDGATRNNIIIDGKSQLDWLISLTK